MSPKRSLRGLDRLPARVVGAITHHHDPQISVATGLNPTIAVHVANAVAHAKNNAKGADGLLQSEYLRSIGVSGELKDWM